MISSEVDSDGEPVENPVPLALQPGWCGRVRRHTWRWDAALGQGPSNNSLGVFE